MGSVSGETVRHGAEKNGGWYACGRETGTMRSSKGTHSKKYLMVLCRVEGEGASLNQCDSFPIFPWENYVFRLCSPPAQCMFYIHLFPCGFIKEKKLNFFFRPPKGKGGHRGGREGGHERALPPLPCLTRNEKPEKGESHVYRNPDRKSE